MVKIVLEPGEQLVQSGGTPLVRDVRIITAALHRGNVHGTVNRVRRESYGLAVEVGREDDQPVHPDFPEAPGVTVKIRFEDKDKIRIHDLEVEA